MLTIYNFSLHKSPQQGYDRQKKKCKTTISPLLTFNLKVGFTFSVLSPKACPYVLIRKFSPRATQLQIIDNQYSIKIVGGRELSRPYQVWFFAEGERFLSFRRCHRPRKRAALGVWCG